jgi:CxxC motif-containing protein (DUF1111 family)
MNTLRRAFLVLAAGGIGVQLLSAAPPPRLGGAGGGTTVADDSAHAYGRAAANLEPGHWTRLRAGKLLFVQTWLPAGSGQAEREGLGPLFNARSCEACHFQNGRGRLPDDALREQPALLFRLGLSTGEPEPRYGGQLQDQAVPPARPEGRGQVSLVKLSGRYPDGRPYTLQRPEVRLTGLRAGALAAGTRVSARIPSSLVGLGLLQAIPTADVVARADPEDADGDGVSGRPHWVTRAGAAVPALGRFGWRAAHPTLAAQIEGALREDMGLTVAGDASAAEVSAEQVERLVFYLSLLGVPERRGAEDPEVRRGEALFARVGCAACHTPAFTTGGADLPELAGQEVHPYTDLLLHDMGDELADGLPDDGGAGREWRTPPLWGLGRLGEVSGEVRLLHDGRARRAEDAILWHGGEGRRARDAFAALDARSRASLLRFLESL